MANKINVIVVSILLIITWSAMSGSLYSKETPDPINTRMVPNTVVIKFEPHITIQSNSVTTSDYDLDNLLKANQIASLDPVIKSVKLAKANPMLDEFTRIYIARFEGDVSPKLVAENLSAFPYIEYAEPKFIHQVNAVPNDTLYHNQKTYYDLIKAPQSWDLVKGNDGEVVIAIVDGGTDIDHVDLSDNIWVNQIELNGTEGVDDDGNNYPDDVYGWNFANASGDPTGLDNTPFNADHGTYTAGIVSAVSDNITGVAGVSWNATIMAINASHGTEDKDIAYGYEGIIYAASNGADVINCSWGSQEIGSGSELGKDAVQFASLMGAAVIGAAGNNGNIDPHYPSSFKEVLSVAATDTLDHLWQDSNYGSEIDMAAPGVDIFSLLADNQYGIASGTSSAAPLVSGIVGLINTNNSGWSGVQAGEQVRVTSDQLESLTESTGRGRLNAYRALTESSPSIRFFDYTFIDENENGLVEAGERIELVVKVQNYLEPAKNIRLNLSTSSTYVSFVNDEFIISQLGTLEQDSGRFVIDIAPNTSGNPLIIFDIQILADGYEDKDRFSFERVYPPKIWDKHDENPVVTKGQSGEWDDHGISVQSVIYDSLSATYKMWYTGGREFPRASIGYATSLDGITWERYQYNPILTPGAEGEWDDLNIGLASVVREDGENYHLWYAATSDKLIYSIGYATSPDGIDWEKYKDNPVMTVGPAEAWDETWVSFPFVLFDGSIFKMWYAGYSGDPVTFDNWQGRIGYATSSYILSVGPHKNHVSKERRFYLAKNYPNPFNPSTIINYELRITSVVDLSIYNILGQKVASLVSQKQSAGKYQVQWDGSSYSSGVYYYVLKTGEFLDVKKMILLR
jgi:hypothetical protein